MSEIMDSMVLIGFGGHAKSVIDSIEQRGDYRIEGYTDIMEAGDYHGYPYLGTDEILEQLYHKGIQNAFVTVGYMGGSIVRDKLFQALKRIGYNIPAIIDLTAIVAKDATIGTGSYIGKRAVINSQASIGEMCIINTGAIIEHENIIGDFSHIAVNATLCGNVHIMHHCMIGASSTIIQGIRIGEYCTIGAGSIVIRDILPNQKVCGLVK